MNIEVEKMKKKIEFNKAKLNELYKLRNGSVSGEETQKECDELVYRNISRYEFFHMDRSKQNSIIYRMENFMRMLEDKLSLIPLKYGYAFDYIDDKWILVKLNKLNSDIIVDV